MNIKLWVLFLSTSFRTVSSNAQCNESAIVCAVEELKSIRAELKNVTEVVLETVAPVEAVMAQYMEFSGKINEMVVARDSVEATLEVASQLPYVGKGFVAPKGAIEPLKPPLERFESFVDGVNAHFVQPVGDTLSEITGALQDLDTVLEFLTTQLLTAYEDGQDKVMDGLIAVWETQCVRAVSSILSSGFEPMVNKMETVINQLSQALELIKAKAELVVDQLNNYKFNGLTVAEVLSRQISSFKPFSRSMKFLLPINDILEEDLTLGGYIKNIKAKESGLPNKCQDDDWEKFGGLCMEPCKDGFQRIGPRCMRKCPRGYPEAGVACVNQYYGIRAIKPRKVKVKFGKKGWKKLKPKISFSCDSGFSKAPNELFCWKDVKEGWQGKNFFAFGVEFKGCPEGFEIDPTKTLCVKKSHSYQTKAMVCGDDQESFGLGCIDKCSGGEIDIGLLCLKVESLAFQLKEVPNVHRTLMDTVKKFKGVKQVMKLEDELEKVVELAVSKLFGWMNIPGEDMIPVPDALLTNGMATFTGPIDDLLDGLLNLDLDTLLDQMGFDVLQPEYESQQRSLLSGFGFDFDALNTTLGSIAVDYDGNISSVNADGLMSGAGMPSFDLSGISDVFDSFTDILFQSNFVDNLSNLASTIGSSVCSQTDTYWIPIEEGTRRLLKQQIPASMCEIPILYCSDFGIDVSSVSRVLDTLLDLVSPAIDAMANVIGAAGRRRSLRGLASVIDMDENNFSLPPIPIPLMPNVFMATNWVKEMKYGKNYFRDEMFVEEGKMATHHLKLDSGYTVALLRFGKEDGKAFLRLEAKLVADAPKFIHAKRHPHEQMEHNEDRLDKAIEESRSRLDSCESVPGVTDEMIEERREDYRPRPRIKDEDDGGLIATYNKPAKKIKVDSPLKDLCVDLNAVVEEAKTPGQWDGKDTVDETGDGTTAGEGEEDGLYEEADGATPGGGEEDGATIEGEGEGEGGAFARYEKGDFDRAEGELTPEMYTLARIATLGTEGVVEGIEQINRFIDGSESTEGLRRLSQAGADSKVTALLIEYQRNFLDKFPLFSNPKYPFNGVPISPVIGLSFQHTAFKNAGFEIQNYLNDPSKIKQIELILPSFYEKDKYEHENFGFSFALRIGAYVKILHYDG